MSNNIHSTAIVSPSAKLGENVYIGPYCVIGDDVVIGNNVSLHSHVVIDGITTIGDGNTIFPFASIGLVPQDKKYKGEASKLIIGNNNVIREYVTIHPGTSQDRMITQIGDNCLLMISCHIAHDCTVGNNVILANNVTLGGHVEVGDFAIIGGLSGVHQFVRIGKHAMIGGMSAIESDVIPFGITTNERAYLAGLNLVGLKRRNFPRETIHALRGVYQIIFENNQSILFNDRLKMAEAEYGDIAEVIDMLSFLSQDDARAICKPKTSQNAE